MTRAALLLSIVALAAGCGADEPPRVSGDALTLWEAYDEVRGDCTEDAASEWLANDRTGKGGDPCMPGAVVTDAIDRLDDEPCVHVPRGAGWAPLRDVAGDLADEIRLTGWDDDARELERAARNAPNC